MSTLSLTDVLRRNYPVSDETAAMLEKAARVIHVRKRDYLVQQDHRSDHIYFILKGLFRGVHVFDGVESTLIFGTAGDPFASAHSFAHGEAAQISFHALEDSDVAAIGFDRFRALLQERPDLQAWWNAVLIEQIYALERRYISIGTSKAEKRYENLLRARAEIIHRIPIKYIAQYLNVAPETLSRVRRRIVSGKRKGQSED